MIQDARIGQPPHWAGPQPCQPSRLARVRRGLTPAFVAAESPDSADSPRRSVGIALYRRRRARPYRATRAAVRVGQAGTNGASQKAIIEYVRTSQITAHDL